MGARRNGSFVYDNELPGHRVTTRGFAIQSFPVTNASFLSFAEGGGYEHRPWWSEEGWAWKQCYDITHPAPRVEGDLAAAGLELVDRFTHDEERFALSLARPL